MSLSGLPLASFSLFSRSIDPPVMYSTGTPVAAVNLAPMMLATMSRQLPPQTLTTSLSCAVATAGARHNANVPSARPIRFMLLSLVCRDDLLGLGTVVRCAGARPGSCIIRRSRVLVNIQRCGGLPRVVGRSRRRLFVRQCRHRLCAADRSLCTGGANRRCRAAADAGD